MSLKSANRRGGGSKNGLTPGGKTDRKQIRGQRRVDRAVKKGKMLDIAVHSDDNKLQGNFKLDPKGVTVGKGGYIADTDETYSLTSDGVVKKGIHNYSEKLDEPYKLYANQDLVGRVGKKVNFKKRNKK